MKHRFRSGWVALLVITALTGCGDGESVFEAAAGPTSTVTPATTPAPATTAAPTTEAPATTAAAPTTLSPATTAAPATTTSATPPTTVSPATTGSTATSTTATTDIGTPLPPTCPQAQSAGPIPPQATAIDTLAGDFDGNGLDGWFSSYENAGMYYLHAELDSGFTTIFPLDGWFEGGVLGGLSVGPVWVERILNLGVPNEFALVHLGAGLVNYYGLFSFEECRLFPVVDETGEMADVWFADGLMHRDEPLCDGSDEIRMTVFGATAGCADIDTCDPVNRQVLTYRVTHPDSIDLISDVTDVVSAATMSTLLAGTCLTW